MGPHRFRLVVARGNKWVGQVMLNKVTQLELPASLGARLCTSTYSTPEEAARAVDRILYKLGRYSAMNFSLSKDAENELDSIGIEEFMEQVRANTSHRSKKTSAYRGVSLQRTGNKWIPSIGSIRGNINLPYVVEESEAALSYDRAAIALGRPESELNFPDRRPESESLIDDKLLMKLFGTTDKDQIQALVLQDQQHRQGSNRVKGWNKIFQAIQTQRKQETSPLGPSQPSTVCPRPSGGQHAIHDSSRQQQMGASDEVDLSGAALERPAGGMQQVAQHKGGPGAQGMKPLTEAERVQVIQLGQQQQQQQSLVEIEEMEQAYMQKEAMIWDRSSQQVPRPYAVPHAPQSSIPGLPNMFIQMPTYNGVETGGKPPPAGSNTQQQGIKRNRKGGYYSPTPGGEGPGGPLAMVSGQKHLSSRVDSHARQADEGGHMTPSADMKRLRQDKMGEAAAHVGLLPLDVRASYKEEAQSGKVSPLDRQSEDMAVEGPRQSEGRAVGGPRQSEGRVVGGRAVGGPRQSEDMAVEGRMMDMGSLALVPSYSLPLASVSPRSTNHRCSTAGAICYIGDDNDLAFMLLKAVRLAHTSAVQQGLAEAGTFAKCRRSFLTWMAGTPMSQLSEQGTDLEQMNSIERRLLRYADDAAYCLDLLSILGFSWFSGERAKPISKSTWH